MGSGWRTVRIFISSTFRDMQAERSHLVRIVFPKLRERLYPHAVYLEDVDLRWGITKEQSENAETMDLCLDKIDECRPYFLGLLGERYGSVITSAPPTTLASRGLDAFAERSVTELEMLYGALEPRPQSMRAFFFLRDRQALDGIPAEVRLADFEEGTFASKALLADLKRRILTSGHLVRPYVAKWQGGGPDKAEGQLVGLESFGEQVLEALWAALEEDLDLAAAQSPGADELDEERARHERFAEDRIRVFVGREAQINALLDYALSDDRRPCFVSGPGGSGKSAVIAKFAADLRQRRPDARAILHFAGASTKSGDLDNLLERLSRELEAAAGDAVKDQDEHVTEALAERALRTRFSDALAALPGDRPTILVIDGLDQIDDAVDLYGLDWLPAVLPACVKLVTSGASDTQRGTALRAALDHREHLAIEVAALSMRERDAIVREVPILWAKMLGADQINMLLANPAAENALYLRVALEELHGFGSFSRLDERIRTLPNASASAPRRWWRRPPAPQVDIPESIYLLFVEAIKRLEDEFSVATVRAILTGILLSRSGLAEHEARDLAGGTSDDTNVYAVLRLIRPYTISRQGLLKFYHQQIENAVRRYYLVDREAQTATHLSLAAYFDAQPWRIEADAGVMSPNLRKCDELAWHLTHGGDRGRALRLFEDPDFYQSKADAGLVVDLADDITRLVRSRSGLKMADLMAADSLKAWRRMGGEDRVDDDERIGFPRQRLTAIEEAIRRHGDYLSQQPDRLFQCLWNGCWWQDAAALTPYSEMPVGQPTDLGLSRWLEAWRARRIAEGVSDPWLRTLRPPSPPLGAARRTLFHSAPVAALATFARSRRLVSGGGSLVRVWEVDRGAVLRTIRLYQTFSIEARLSLAIGGRSDRLDDDESADVQCLACAPDGQRLAVGYGRNIAIYDVVSGERLLILTCEEGEAKKVAFSPDGKLVCACNGYEWIYLWDAETGAPRGRLGEPSEDGMNVLGVGFIGPNNLWATNQAGGRGYRWETVVWDVARAVVVERKPAVEIAQLARDGRHLMLAMPGMEVEGGASNTIVAAYQKSGKQSRISHPFDLFLPFGQIALSTDGARIASAPEEDAGLSNNINVVSVASGEIEVTYRCHRATITSLVFLERLDEDRLMAAGREGRAMEDQLLRRAAALDRHNPRYDPTTHLPEWEFPEQLASASADGAICISPRSPPLSPALWPVGLNGEAREARFSPNGHLLATVCRGTGIQLWGGEDGLFIDEVEGGWDVVFSPDSAKFAGRVRQGVRTWSAGDRRALGGWTSEDEIACLGFVGADALLVGYETGDVRLHDAVDGAVRASLPPLGAPARLVEVSADGTLAAVLDEQSFLHVLDMTSLTEQTRFSVDLDKAGRGFLAITDYTQMRLAPDGVLLLRLVMKVSYWHFDGACRGELDFIFDIDRFARRGPVRLPGLGFFNHAPLLEIVDDLKTVVAAAPITLSGRGGYLIRSHPTRDIFAVMSGRDFQLYRLEHDAESA